MKHLAVLLAFFSACGCAKPKEPAPEVLDCYGDTPYEKQQIALHLKRRDEKRAKIHFKDKIAL